MDTNTAAQFWSSERVKRMLWQSPETLRTKDDRSGGTPLHGACELYSPADAIRLLVAAFPVALAIPDNRGRTPLHRACVAATYPDVIRLLVEAFPAAAAMRDADGKTPLDHWVCDFGHVMDAAIAATRANRSKEGDEADGDATSADGLLRHSDVVRELQDHLGQFRPEEFWDVTCCLVASVAETARRGRCEIPPAEPSLPYGTGAEIHGTRGVVHDCLRIDHCDARVILLALRLHPEQLAETDEDGNTALHVAAANATLNGLRVCWEDGCGDYLTAVLVKLHPDAASLRNADGRRPFHLAIESGKTWEGGVGAIVGAAGDVVAEEDEGTKLLPFMKAAAADDPCLDMIYGLLRAYPVLDGFQRLQSEPSNACGRRSICSYPTG